MCEACGMCLSGYATHVHACTHLSWGVKLDLFWFATRSKSCTAQSDRTKCKLTIFNRATCKLSFHCIASAAAMASLHFLALMSTIRATGWLCAACLIRFKAKRPILPPDILSLVSSIHRPKCKQRHFVVHNHSCTLSVQWTKKWCSLGHMASGRRRDREHAHITLDSIPGSIEYSVQPLPHPECSLRCKPRNCLSREGCCPRLEPRLTRQPAPLAQLQQQVH